MKNKLFWLGIVTISAVLLGVFSTQRLTVEAGENGHGGTHREWSYYWGEWSECRTNSDVTCGETLKGWKTRTLYRKCVWTLDGHDRCKLGDVQETERTERERCRVELPACPTPTPEPRPEPSPEPTPEPSPQPEKPLSVPEAPKGPVCEDLGGWSPTITRVWREDSDTVGFEWSKPRDEADEYILHFGLTEDSLPYNKTVKGQWTTVDLPDYPNVHVWGAVEETDQGCVGNRSVVVDP